MTVRELQGGVEIVIHAQPRASRSEVVGLHGDALKVRLAVPPVDGAANAELIRVMAKVLGVPKGSAQVTRGHSGKSKIVRVAGLAVEDARASRALVSSYQSITASRGHGASVGWALGLLATTLRTVPACAMPRSPALIPRRPDPLGGSQTSETEH